MRSWLFLVVVIGGGTALDQRTKQWAGVHVQGNGILTLMPGLVDLRYVRNPSGFFGLGAALSPDLRRMFLILAGAIVIGLIAWLYGRTRPEQFRLRVALSFLASGAASNLIDRIRVGAVVDFIYLHAGALLHWATFNLADVLIVFGLLLLALELARPQLEPGRAGALPQPASTDGGY
jgi:signal peptidase II